MNKKIRFLLCLLLSVAMLLTMGASVMAEPAEDEEETVEETVEVDLSGYEKIAESGNLAMYANAEDAHFYLEDLTSGKKWHSTPTDTEANRPKGTNRGPLLSQLVIHYVNESEMATIEYPQTANSNADSYGEGAMTVEFNKDGMNGMLVTYGFPAVGITVPVKYELKDGEFFASLLVEKITEEPIDDNRYILVDVDLLPSFGAGCVNDEGYLFVPDGSGALVGFNNGIELSSNYVSMVYGSDKSIVPETQITYTESVRLPVFGTVVGSDALMGIISEGDSSASIQVINGDEKSLHTAINARFHYRVMQAQYNLFNKRKINFIAEPTAYGFDEFTVRYSTLTGDDADYIGMATKYREYLVKEKGLSKVDDAYTPSFHLNAVGSFEQDATFLGVIPYTERIALTTYDECQQMLKDLQAADIKNITLRYTGWSNNGIENVKIPKGATALKKLGGQKAFAALQSFAATAGVEFYPEVDLLTYQKNGNGISVRKNAVRSIFGKTMLLSKYMLSTYVTKLGTNTTVLLSPEKLDFVGGRYLTSLTSQKLSAVSLSNLGEYTYSNFYEKNEQFRALFPSYVEAMLKKYEEADVKMSFDGGNAYVLPYASIITNVPMNSSGYDIFMKDVPFYQSVIHGYVPYTTRSLPQTADPEMAYLAAVETGTELAYIGIHEQASLLFDTEYNYLYGSTYTLWMDKAAQQYKEYMPVLEKIATKVIVDHRELADNVFMTEYEGGTQVIVNYNDKAVTVQGTEIKAKSFTDAIQWTEEVTGDE